MPKGIGLADHIGYTKRYKRNLTMLLSFPIRVLLMIAEDVYTLKNKPKKA